MKKNYLIITLILTIFLTGCFGSLDDKDIRENFIKETESLKSYYLEGTLKINNNDDNYEYDVKVSYEQNEKYKVSLINKANDYEQIILKNNNDIYVITPSLNKSFKFQSDWPNNNSQSYLLDSVAKDLKNDEEYTFTQKDKNYIFTTKTNYPNNPKYTKQNIILDKNYNLKKVEVQDSENITYVEFEVTSIDKKADFNEKTFELEEITKNFKLPEEEKENEKNENEENSVVDEPEEPTEKTETTSKIDENVFPLYLPINTSLSDKEVIETEAGERVIMTFSGENPFILVQETAKVSEELEIIPTYGEPFMLIDTVGSLTDTSYTWTSNGVEYYIVSDQMDKTELLEVAKSINVVSAINEK